MSTKRSSKVAGPRWWLLVSIFLIADVSLGLTWFSGDQIRQHRVIQTGAILILATLACLIWLLCFSRLAWKTRWIILSSLSILILAAVALFRIEGVSGDLVPALVWRWSSPGEWVSTETGLTPEISDYPQFLGPKRDGVLPPFPLAQDWRTSPPKLLWRRPVGEGWSAFAVHGNLAVTQEQRGADEQIAAYQLSSGEPVWSYSYPAHYETVLAGVGPRATPTVDSGQVFAVGATGILTCLDLQTGKLLWSRPIVQENGGTIPVWGYSASPLVLNDLVVVNACGPNGKSLVSFHRRTGQQVWTGGDDACGYSSPQFREIAGIKQILTFNHSTVSGHSPSDGQLLWIHDWPSHQPNVSQPVVLPGSRVFASSGYGVGAKLLQVTAGANGALAAELLWETPRLKAKFTNIVLHKGLLYGLDDGILVCMDPEDGQRLWKEGRYGHGQVILVGDLLLLQTEHGEIVLLKPDPQQRRELTRFQALEGKTWNPPALAGRYLLVRNHKEAACYELPTSS